MIVKRKERNPDSLDLTPDQPHFVIGIEANTTQTPFMRIPMKM